MAGQKGRSGGARPGAGRPAKPPAINDHADPLEFLRAVWTGELEANPAQVKAAAAALPYLHGRKGEGGKKEAAAEAAKAASTGRFAPGKPPRRLN